jgi:hypothetical protein
VPDGVALPPLKMRDGAPNGYHYDPELGYHCHGARAEGRTIIIEDFINADPAFDFLVDHPRTMAYVHEVVKEKPSINNTEIRCRYHGNQSGSHGSGSVVSRKYRYDYRPESGIECGMVRMVCEFQPAALLYERTVDVVSPAEPPCVLWQISCGTTTTQVAHSAWRRPATRLTCLCPRSTSATQTWTRPWSGSRSRQAT